MEFYKNDFGVKIKKCCSSCIHKTDKNGGLRSCEKGYNAVRNNFLCADGWWELDPTYNIAAKGGGKVKKRKYLEIFAANGRAAAEEWANEHGGKYLERR